MNLEKIKDIKHTTNIDEVNALINIGWILLRVIPNQNSIVFILGSYNKKSKEPTIEFIDYCPTCSFLTITYVGKFRAKHCAFCGEAFKKTNPFDYY